MATTAPRTGLSRPDYGDSRWDDDIQAWLDKLDTAGAFADLALSWTATQTFLVTQSFATVEATRVEATRVVATVGELSSVEAVAVEASGSLAVGSTALAPGYFCQVLTAGAAATDTDAGAEGDGIVLAAAPGQESTHVTGTGGTGGMATLSGGTGGVGDTDGPGGTVLVQGGIGGGFGGGAQGNVRINGTNVFVDGLFHLSDKAAAEVQTVTLIGDNQVITPSKSYILVLSDNATATNRTFTVAAPSSASYTGQVLVLVWGNTNKGELVADTTTHLAGTWPDGSNPHYDTLTLISSGTDWIEVSRSINT